MDRMKAVLTLSAAMLFAASPMFFGGFGGFDPRRFPNPPSDPPIVPAGYAFSIWGLIYAYLLIHAGFGLLARDVDARWDRVRWPLIISLTVGASWIPVAQFNPAWATVLIWIMLVSALIALFRSTDEQDRWLLQTPLAIYAGWLSAASFVSVALIGAGYDVMTDQLGWAWIALVASLIFAVSVQLKLARAPEYGLTVIWALAAIAVRSWESQSSFAVAAIAGAVLLGFVCRRSLSARKAT